MHLFWLTLAGVFLLIPRTGALAQSPGRDFPTRPIKVITTVSPGAAQDVLARALSDPYRAKNGHGFVVENRVGGGVGQVVGVNACRTSAPDGYTLCILTQNAVTIAPGLYKNLGYDPLKVLEPVTMVASQQQALIVSGSLPVNTFSELVAYSKQNPNKLNFGSIGTGTDSHLIFEWLKKVSGGDWTHVPFTGLGPILQAISTGQVHMFQLTVGGGLVGQLRAGTLKALMVPGDTRNPLLADVPTYEEAGLPKVDRFSWTGLFAPAGTPKGVIDQLSGDIAEITREKEFQERFLLPLGFKPMGWSADDFKSYLPKDAAVQKSAIEAAGNIQID
jgi:tripartite-type tricarboxylate transporter receptor subunit TctC